MIVLDGLRVVVICLCLLVLLVMAFVTVYMYKKGNEYKYYILKPVIVGALSMIAYCAFLFCKTLNAAIFWDSMFFIGTDWLAFFMLLFAVAYTGIGAKNLKVLTTAGVIVYSADSLGLLINNFTSHMFTLTLMHTFDVDYWGNVFGPLHYVHLGLCYISVILTFVIYILGIISAASPYKSKYIGVFVCYLIVIVVNCVCYSLNLPYDFSVILYGILAGFISYYSTWLFPHVFLNSSLKAVNDTISDAILYYDINGNCIYSNKSARQLFENDGVFIPCMTESYLEKWENQAAPDQVYLKGEDCFKSQGQEIHFEVEYQKVFCGEFRVGSCLKLLDKTEEFSSYQKEKYIATHDALTGTLNRLGFLEAVDARIAECGTEDWIMLVSNVKDFKLINELFGEKLGDEVICKQADIFRKFSSPESIYARMVDDKYAVYTRCCNFVEGEFIEYMKLMQQMTKSPLYKMHIQAGVYTPKGRIESAQNMYDKALIALCENKNNYNKIFSYYDSVLMDKLLNEKNIAEDFESAIEKNQIKMYLQPVYDNNKKIVAAEALSRWDHPFRGNLLPEEFIEILEKKGLIIKLDKFIWEQSAIMLKKLSDKGLKDIYISVNISVKDFFYSDLFEIFTGLVQKYNLQPSNFRLEITEAVLMSDFARAFSIASKLQSAGFIVTIDNFGTGHSSLNMLKDFNTSSIKIAMDLLKLSAEQERNYIIVKSIIEMADLLKMDVVAEGVENADQLDNLKKCGCNLYQGNYFSKPVPSEAFEALLNIR